MPEFVWWKQTPRGLRWELNRARTALLPAHTRPLCTARGSLEGKLMGKGVFQGKSRPLLGRNTATAKLRSWGGSGQNWSPPVPASRRAPPRGTPANQRRVPHAAANEAAVGHCEVTGAERLGAGVSPLRVLSGRKQTAPPGEFISSWSSHFNHFLYILTSSKISFPQLAPKSNISTGSDYIFYHFDYFSFPTTLEGKIWLV